MTARKMLDVDFNTLAYDQAFDFIPSQDPKISLRLCIPVADWRNSVGGVRKSFEHADIVDYKGEKRFKFYNHKDKREQHVKIDGTGVIVVNGMKPEDWQALYNFVLIDTHGVNTLNGDDLNRIMRFLRIQRSGNGDFYQSTAGAVRAHMHPWQEIKRGYPFGGYLPNPNLSAAIGYQGPVTFHVLDGPPQKHEKGGFVTFPTISAQEVRLAGREGIFTLCAERKVTPRAVEAGVLMKQNSLPGNSPIPAPKFRRWVRRPPAG